MKLEDFGIFDVDDVLPAKYRCKICGFATDSTIHWNQHLHSEWHKEKQEEGE